MTSDAFVATPQPRLSVARKVTGVEEVSLAASQQLLSLAVVALGEGAWSSCANGFTVEKALKYLPSSVAAVILVAASGSVGSGEAASMAPGLGLSCLASGGLLASYILRLAAKDKEAPPKEIVGLFAAIAFFGFSISFQSLFAAGIIQNPLAGPTVVEGFPDL